MPRPQRTPYAALFMVGLLLGVGATGEALAASQGRIATTSVAATTIGIVIPPNLQVAWPASSFVNLSGGAARHALCVSGRGVSAYAIAVAGSGAGGQFALSNGPNEVLYSAAMFTDQAEALSLRAGLKTPAIKLPATNACQQVSLVLKLNEGEAETPVGGHSGILTVVVSPE